MSGKPVAAVIALAMFLASCATPAPVEGTDPVSNVPAANVADAGLAAAWVSGAAEYVALTGQIYRSAREDLERFVADPDWNALPEYAAGPGLAPAVILDVDETVLDNSPYQIAERGVYDSKTWDRWIADRAAPAVPGAVEFLRAARAAGVSAFFVTNRKCRQRAADSVRCPQKEDTLRNLEAVGIVTDAQHLMLRDERSDWTSEKSVRRDEIAASHRVIMLFGDDLADFLSCVRVDVIAPCTQSSGRRDRLRRTLDANDRWGNGWYVLPNPMYGSWSEVQ